MVYILAQILGAIGWLFYFSSFFSKRLNKIVFVQILSSIFYCLNYFLLGAWAGLFINAFELFKGIGYYKTDKDKYIFYYTIPIYVLIGMVSEKSILCMIPILASIITGYGTLKSRKAILVTSFIANSTWVIYDLYYLDYVLAFSDTILAIFNLGMILYGYSKYLNRKNVYTVNRKDITLDTLRRIYNLDNEYYDDNYCWDFEEIKKIYQKERSSYILVKDRNTVVGYVNILSIDKSVYDSIDSSNVFFDQIDEKDIIEYSNKDKEYYLTINSIVLKNEYQNKDTVDKIILAIKKYINLKIKHGYNIKEVNSYAINLFEKNILEKLGMNKARNITNECFLYKLELDNKMI